VGTLRLVSKDSNGSNPGSSGSGSSGNPNPSPSPNPNPNPNPSGSSNDGVLGFVTSLNASMVLAADNTDTSDVVVHNVLVTLVQVAMDLADADPHTLKHTVTMLYQVRVCVCVY
jgi:hypothetical protein